jgi:hypothetical protein
MDERFCAGAVMGVLFLLLVERVRWARKRVGAAGAKQTVTMETKQTPRQVVRQSCFGVFYLLLFVMLLVIFLVVFAQCASGGL